MNKLSDIFSPAAGNAINAASALSFLKGKEIVHSKLVAPLQEYLDEHKFHGVRLRLTGGHLARDADTERTVVCLSCNSDDPNCHDRLDIALATLESEISLQSADFNLPVWVLTDDTFFS